MKMHNESTVTIDTFHYIESITDSSVTKQSVPKCEFWVKHIDKQWIYRISGILKSVHRKMYLERLQYKQQLRMVIEYSHIICSCLIFTECTLIITKEIRLIFKCNNY